MPVHITTLKRAVNLLFMGAAKGVDHQYQTYQWEQLLDTPETHEAFYPMKSLRGIVYVPKVIVLAEYEKLPQRNVRFSRQHIFLRDQFTCQYCANEFPKSKLNLDHVVPRSRGGKTTWDNLVTSCHGCNRRKADRTPQEAKMPLLKKPKRPSGTFGLLNLKRIHSTWQPFLLGNMQT